MHKDETCQVLEQVPKILIVFNPFINVVISIEEICSAKAT